VAARPHVAPVVPAPLLMWQFPPLLLAMLLTAGDLVSTRPLRTALCSQAMNSSVETVFRDCAGLPQHGREGAQQQWEGSETSGGGRGSRGSPAADCSIRWILVLRHRRSADTTLRPRANGQAHNTQSQVASMLSRGEVT